MAASAATIAADRRLHRKDCTGDRERIGGCGGCGGSGYVRFYPVLDDTASRERDRMRRGGPRINGGDTPRAAGYPMRRGLFSKIKKIDGREGASLPEWAARQVLAVPKQKRCLPVHCR